MFILGFFKEINIARGIGIFLVVLGHSFPTDDYNNNFLWVYIHKFIYSFHMPLFFFISGFCAIKIYEITDVKKYTDYVKNKFKRLMVPYFLVTFMAIPIKLLMNRFAQRPVTLSKLVIDILIYPWDNPIIFFWFIYTLFLIFLTVPLLNKISTKYVMILFIIINLLPIHYPKLLNISGLICYITYFYIGILIRKGYSKFTRLEHKGLISLVCFFVLTFVNYINMNFTLMQGSNIVVAIIGIICCLCIASSIKNNSVGSFFDILGKYSFDIYLFSWFFQTGSRVVFYQILKFNYNVVIVIMILAGFLPILLSKTILNKSDIVSKFILGKSARNITAA